MQDKNENTKTKVQATACQKIKKGIMLYDRYQSAVG